MSLSNNAIRASGWQLLAVVIQAVLHYGTLFFMARYTSPENWSVITVTMIVITFAQTISDAGLGPALIQRREITDLHKRVALTTSFLLGVGMMALVAALAEPLARFYELPALRKALLAAGLSFVFQAFGLIAKSLLKRELNFRRIMWVETLAYGFGYATVGITLAVLDFGVWAIIFATLAYSALSSVLYFLSARHSVRPSLHMQSLKDLTSFGGGLTLSRIFHFAGKNVDKLILGKVLGHQLLGIYDMAFRLMMLPANNLGNVVDNVMFPTLSSAQSDVPAMRRAYLGVISVLSVLYFPLTVFVVIVAEELILTILGAKWQPAVLPLRLLMISSCFRINIRMCDATVRAIGAVYQSAVRKLLFVLTVALAAWLGGTKGGIVGACVGLGIADAVTYCVMALLCCQLLQLSVREFFQRSLAGISLSIITGITAFATLYAFRSVDLLPPVVLGLTTLSVTLAVGVAAWIRPALLGNSGLLLVQKTLSMVGPNHRLVQFVRHHFSLPAKLEKAA